jgi:hypothetical protein
MTKPRQDSGKRPEEDPLAGIGQAQSSWINDNKVNGDGSQNIERTNGTV